MVQRMDRWLMTLIGSNRESSRLLEDHQQQYCHSGGRLQSMNRADECQISHSPTSRCWYLQLGRALCSSVDSTSSHTPSSRAGWLPVPTLIPRTRTRGRSRLMRRGRWLGKPLKWFCISEGRSEPCGILERQISSTSTVLLFIHVGSNMHVVLLHIVPTPGDRTSLPLKAMSRYESLLRRVHHGNGRTTPLSALHLLRLQTLAPGPSLHANDGLVLVLFSGFPNLPSSRPPYPFPLPRCGGGPYPPLPPPLIPNPPRSGPGPGFEGPVGAPGTLAPGPLAPVAFAPVR
jgi:hypothetical protein